MRLNVWDKRVRQIQMDKAVNTLKIKLMDPAIQSKWGFLSTSSKISSYFSCCSQLFRDKDNFCRSILSVNCKIMYTV